MGGGAELVKQLLSAVLHIAKYGVSKLQYFISLMTKIIVKFQESA